MTLVFERWEETDYGPAVFEWCFTDLSSWWYISSYVQVRFLWFMFPPSAGATQAARWMSLRGIWICEIFEYFHRLTFGTMWRMDASVIRWCFIVLGWTGWCDWIGETWRSGRPRPFWRPGTVTNQFYDIFAEKKNSLLKRRYIKEL